MSSKQTIMVIQSPPGSHQLHLRPHVPSSYPPHPSPAQHHPGGCNSKLFCPSLTIASLSPAGLGTALRPLDLGGHLPANGFQVNQAFAAHQVGNNCNCALLSHLSNLSSSILDKRVRQWMEETEEERPNHLPRTPPLCLRRLHCDRCG